MKYSIQLKVTKATVETFIKGLASQGYTAVRVLSTGVVDIHFTIDGKTSADYSATMFAGGPNYVSFRPQ